MALMFQLLGRCFWLAMRLTIASFWLAVRLAIATGCVLFSIAGVLFTSQAKVLPASAASVVGPSKQLMATIGPRGGRYYERTSKDGNNYRQYF